MNDIKDELRQLSGEIQLLHSRMEEIIKALGEISRQQNEKRQRSVAPAPSKIKKKLSDADMVVGMIRRYKNGVNVVTLREKTGFNEKKISNIVFRASQKGQIKRIGRGLYAAVK